MRQLNDLKNTLTNLKELFDEEKTALERINKIQNAENADRLWSSGGPDEKLQKLLSGRREELEIHRESQKETLKNFSLFPDRFCRKQEVLNQFWQDGAFDKSVFIMTKFVEGDDTGDKQLEAVINGVQEAIKNSGYIPRIAQGRPYHDFLWDNVETYMIGCHAGVAILEDKYRPELNPNVAIEWGCMLGMGRKVWLLKERNFKHMRADYIGRLSQEFEWENPEAAISNAIATWFPAL